MEDVYRDTDRTKGPFCGAIEGGAPREVDPMDLIDTHAHAQDERLASKQDVLGRALRAGVRILACCGISPDDWPGVAALAENENPRVLPFYGLHPGYVADAPTDWFDRLQERVSTSRAGIGEIGLDYALPDVDAGRQQAAFVRQYRLSVERARPVTAHVRRAWGSLLDALAFFGPHPAGLAVHAYSGSADFIDRLVPFGAYIGFGGSIVRMRPERARALLERVPPDRLLFETDAPDLAPPLPPEDDFLARDARGRPINEPAVLPWIVRRAAELLDKDPRALAAQTTANARRWLGGLLE